MGRRRPWGNELTLHKTEMKLPRGYAVDMGKVPVPHFVHLKKEVLKNKRKSLKK